MHLVKVNVYVAGAGLFGARTALAAREDARKGSGTLIRIHIDESTLDRWEQVKALCGLSGTIEEYAREAFVFYVGRLEEHALLQLSSKFDSNDAVKHTRDEVEEILRRP